MNFEELHDIAAKHFQGGSENPAFLAFMREIEAAFLKERRIPQASIQPLMFRGTPIYFDDRRKSFEERAQRVKDFYEK